jgi:hypothetical protein
MPSEGDNLIRFGRSYVWINPDTSVSTPEEQRIGTWRLNRDEDSSGGGGPSATGVLGVLADVLETGGIQVGQLVYSDTNGNGVRLAKADAYSTGVVAGVALTAGAQGDQITITRNELVDVFDITGLVDGGGSGGYFEIGALYYLSATNAGSYTPTPDTTTAGAVVAPVGTAVGPNKFAVEIQSPIVI